MGEERPAKHKAESRAVAVISALTAAGMWPGSNLPDVRYVGRYAKGTDVVERVCVCWLDRLSPSNFRVGGSMPMGATARPGQVRMKARTFRGRDGHCRIVLVGACPECGVVYHADVVS